MTAETYMVSLGGYRFKASENPFKSRNKTKAYNFSSRPRWGGVESLQFKGRKAIPITFDIEVVIEKKSDLEIMPELEKLGDSGEPKKMISISEGGYMGLWVITDFTQKETIPTRSGVFLVHQAQLTIKEWAE